MSSSSVLSCQDRSRANLAQLFDVNAKVPFFLSQEALPRLKDGGRIINVSSVVSRIVAPNLAACSMNKGALDVLTLDLAKHLAPGYHRELARSWHHRDGHEWGALGGPAVSPVRHRLRSPEAHRPTRRHRRCRRLPCLQRMQGGLPASTLARVVEVTYERDRGISAGPC